MSDDGLRLDKWLWHARFFKSRSLAARVCQSRRLRINGMLVGKAHQRVRPGDVLTLPLMAGIRIVRVLQLGERRGPAAEACTLYEDLDPAQPALQLPGETPSKPVG
jgi:ribosome-associated heat shock protein Hsp15